MDTTTATATRVEAARVAADVSVLALSARTGIPRTTLIRKLDGKQSFTVQDIEEIAAVLDADPASLVEFKARA